MSGAREWTPPAWWPDALAMIEAGCTYGEVAAAVGVSQRHVGRVDARAGYPGFRDDDEDTTRGPACLVCGRSAPEAQIVMTRARPRPLCVRHSPLGRAAWALREQGLPWHEVGTRLRFALDSSPALRAAKINGKARAWKAVEARRRQRKRRRACKV